MTEDTGKHRIYGTDEISDMSEREILEARFQNDQATLEENRLGKEAQARDSRQSAQDRQENASFDLGKSWVQAGVSFIGLSSAYVSQRHQRHIKPVMEGLNQMFSAVTGIMGAARSLRLANRNLDEIAGKPEGVSDTGETETREETERPQGGRRVALGDVSP